MTLGAFPVRARPQDIEALTERRRPPSGRAAELHQAAVSAGTARFCAGLLTDSERRRAARLPEQAGERFTVARGLLRSVLAGYLGLAPRVVPLRAVCPSCGAPGHGPVRFDDDAGVDWRLSLSHTGRLCAVAVGFGGAPVGIDVESGGQAERLELLERRVLPAGRRHLLAGLSPARRHRAVLTVWTCAEAYAKASGVALGTALRRIGAGIGPGGDFDGRAAEPAGWCVRPYDPAFPGCAAALATPGGVRLRVAREDPESGFLAREPERSTGAPHI